MSENYNNRKSRVADAVESVVENQAQAKKDAEVEAEAAIKSSKQTIHNLNRFSIFHKNTVAFAPDPDFVPSDIEAIANLPPPHAIRRATEDQHSHAHHPWLSILTNKLSKTREDKPPEPSEFEKAHSSGIRQTKNPLPIPYKKHRAEIEQRRAKRDFIYGRDEEYELSDRDCRVKAPCCGVLYFHTMELLDLVVNKQSFIESVPVSYYLNLIIGQIKRTTKVVHSRDSHQIKMDSGIHFSVEVSEWREAPWNRLCLELWSFQDPEAHFIVGTVEIHIYNFIRLQHIIDCAFLWSDGIKVGKLAYEAAFSYGAFGYGHSNQLLNFSQPLMETISHSMFPRIKLDDDADIADKVFQARKPENLKMFTYHSFILEMEDIQDPHISRLFGRQKPTKDKGIQVETKPIVAQQVEFNEGFPVHCKLHMNIYQKVMQADFNDMYGEYVCIGHKRERLEYLTNMVQGRMRDMIQWEAGPIFEHLDHRELDKIHRTETIPGEILYPKKIHCPYSRRFKLTKEDQEFQDQFPTVKRETGYLAQMFGYEQKLEADECLNNMDYPAYKDAKIPEVRNVTVENCAGLFYEWLKRMFLRFQAFMVRLWHFVFPDISVIMKVPDLSLTVATPEGSTTNICSYFAREGKDPNSNRKIDRLVQQTTALIGMTQKNSRKYKMKKKDTEEGDSSLDSLSDNEDEQKLKEDLARNWHSSSLV